MIGADGGWGRSEDLDELAEHFREDLLLALAVEEPQGDLSVGDFGDSGP